MEKKTEEIRLFKVEVVPNINLYVLLARGSHEPQRIAELGRRALVAGFTEDPGPCRVAVAALHVAEERSSGEARVRSPGLHLRMATEGVKQLRDLPEPPEIFSVVYAIASTKEEAMELCKNLTADCENLEEEPLECSRDSLEQAFKTVVRARVERL